MKTIFYAFAVAVTLCNNSNAVQCCRVASANGQEYRLEYQTITEPVQQTTYKKVVETNFVEEEITTYETVWETQKREKRYTVARQVPETSMEQRRYTVNKPVEETIYEDTSYDVVRLVPETTEREERYLVSKQVYETQQQEIVETRRVPVTETVMQEKTYTVNRPVTNYVEQTVDRGGYVDTFAQQPGRTYHRLAWQSGNYYDPATGTSKWRFPGLYWTEMQGQPRYEVNRVYQTNLVKETVPVTDYVPEQRVEQVPVTKTTFRDERISRIEEVQVPKTVQEEVVRKIPVTAYKQVVERVEQKTPVTVRRMVTEERVENVPLVRYKTVMEERVEPYEVKVAKTVPVKRTVRKPVTVEKWVPQTYTIERKKTIVNRVPITAETVVNTEDRKEKTLAPTPIAKPASAPSEADSASPVESSDDPADKVPVLGGN